MTPGKHKRVLCMIRMAACSPPLVPVGSLEQELYIHPLSRGRSNKQTSQTSTRVLAWHHRAMQIPCLGSTENAGQAADDGWVLGNSSYLSTTKALMRKSAFYLPFPNSIN